MAYMLCNRSKGWMLASKLKSEWQCCCSGRPLPCSQCVDAILKTKSIGPHRNAVILRLQVCDKPHMHTVYNQALAFIQCHQFCACLPVITIAHTFGLIRCLFTNVPCVDPASQMNTPAASGSAPKLAGAAFEEASGPLAALNCSTACSRELVGCSSTKSALGERPKLKWPCGEYQRTVTGGQVAGM